MLFDLIASLPLYYPVDPLLPPCWPWCECPKPPVLPIV